MTRGVRSRLALLVLAAILATHLRGAVLGEDAPGDAARLEREGASSYDEGRHEEARQLFLRAFALHEKGGDPAAMARVLHRLGDCLVGLGRLDEARQRFESALAAHERVSDGDPVLAAATRSELGGCLTGLGRDPEALSLLERALAVLEGLGDDPRHGRALYRLADALERVGRAREGIPHARKAVAMLRRVHGETHRDLAWALTTLAFCVSSAGSPAAALPLYEEALGAFRRMHERDHVETADAFDAVGRCLSLLGRLPEALERHRQALAMRTRVLGKVHVAVARSHELVLICLAGQARFAEALPHAERAVEIQRSCWKGDHWEVAKALNLRGATLLMMERSDRALPDFEEAVEMHGRLGALDPVLLAQTVSNLGSCLWSLGRLEEALERLREALARLSRLFGDGHPDLAGPRNSVAACLGELGRHREAHALHEMTLAQLRRRHEGDDPVTAMCLTNLGWNLHELGRDADALPYAREALAMNRRLFGADHYAEAQDHANLADCLVGVGRVEEARTHFERSVDLARKRSSPLLHHWATRLGRLLLDDLDRAKEAVPILAEAIEQLESMRRGARSLDARDLGTYLGHLRRRGPFEAMVRAQLAIGSGDGALEVLERGRARSALDLLERGRTDPLAEARRRSREKGDREAIDRIDEVARRLERTDREIGRLTHALATGAGGPGTAEALDEVRRDQREALRDRARVVRDHLAFASPRSAEDVRSLLGEKERMLLYSLSRRRSVLLLVPPEGEVRGFDLTWPDGSPVTESALEAKVATYAAGLAVRSWRSSLIRAEASETPEAHAALGRELFRTLVPDAVWAEVKGADRVYLVPHGPLHRIPFEALLVETGANDREHAYWLDEGPPVTYGPSASVFLWLRDLADDRGAHGEIRRTAVLLGDPVFSRRESGDGASRSRVPRRVLPRLPGTREEVLEIRKALGAGRDEKDAAPVTVLLGEDATSASLLDHAASARFLHLATHHIPDETDRASYSRLALTLPRTVRPEDDGFLMLVDLLEGWRGRLRACELTVLSGCETSRGLLRRDEGVYAMPLGFMAAGCPAVIASLWRVDDASTAKLMADLYRRLAKPTEGGKLRAWTEARRALRRTHPEPVHWAPFVYLGDPR